MRPADVAHRYRQSADMAKHGVEIVAVGDPLGAAFDHVVRLLSSRVVKEGDEIWGELFHAAKVLRWRRITQPIPARSNSSTIDVVARLRRAVRSLRGAVADTDLLDSIVSASEAIADDQPPVLPQLIDSVDEIRGSDAQAKAAVGGMCIVVALNDSARAALEERLPTRGIHVTTARQLVRTPLEAEKLFVVGPPRFTDPAIVTAPTIADVTFTIPAWFSDVSVPGTRFGEYAVGAIHPPVRLHRIAGPDEMAPDEGLDAIEEALRPKPVWPKPQDTAADQELGRVRARRVFLCGGFGIWLDDGERIRTLDPLQPPGERVCLTDIESVRPGTYLLQRHGVTEPGAMFDAALESLGAKAADILSTQETWKKALRTRIDTITPQRAIRELRDRGVKACDQVDAWTGRERSRPQSDRDFAVLLDWLHIERQPTFSNATQLRNERLRVSTRLRAHLEGLFEQADLTKLDGNGELWCVSDNPRIRKIGALRVVAVSPDWYRVAASELRQLQEDPAATDIE